MRILLAPMQGVVDHPMRELLTGLGGFDRCVTEFVRVVDQRYPERVFHRYSPELRMGGKTSAGTPVFVQLLGGQPKWMAANAVKVARMGAPGIDINFGCPAKTVNQSDGGSVLLQEPERVAAIVAAVRDAVDPAVSVTAKIRLGFNDAAYLQEVAGGVAEAGANELCIHARTRQDGYTPPAHWHAVKKVQSQLAIPVIINGEIWNTDHALKAQQDSGCDDVMLGRGGLACPDLALQIKHQATGESYQPLSWWDVLEYLESYFEQSDQWCSRYVGNRTKQWLAYLRVQYPEAEALFMSIKRLRVVDDFRRAIDQHRATTQFANTCQPRIKAGFSS